MRITKWCMLVPHAVGVVCAQAPVLAPTAHTTITTGGTLHYSSIHVPAGVTVLFSGAQPAIIRCDGDVMIEGAVAVSGSGNGTAWGSPGAYCSDLWGNGYAFSGTGGQHAGVYGSPLPFTMEGGSVGGGISCWTYSAFPYSPCAVWSNHVPGGAGGGTLVINAGGRITVRGDVSARGYPAFLWGTAYFGTAYAYSGPGSGGSILLAGGQGVEVEATGTVTTQGWPGGVFPPVPSSGDGYVRFDSFGTPPVVTGTVSPVPLQVELPHVRASGAPQLGTSWQLHVHAPPADAALIVLAFAPLVVTTPFGMLGIDPAQAVPLAIVALPNQAVDPSASAALAVPANPLLAGTWLWVQAVDFLATGSPRLSNTIAAQMQ